MPLSNKDRLSWKKNHCTKLFFQGLFAHCNLWKDDPAPLPCSKGQCLGLWPPALPIRELRLDTVNRYKVTSVSRYKVTFVDCSHIASKLRRV